MSIKIIIIIYIIIYIILLLFQVGATPVKDVPFISSLKFAEELRTWKQHEERLKSEVAEYPLL